MIDKEKLIKTLTIDNEHLNLLLIEEMSAKRELKRDIKLFRNGIYALGAIIIILVIALKTVL